jgi:hypothetical protein
MTTESLVLVPTPALHPWLSRTLRAELRNAVISASGQSIVALKTTHAAAPSYPLLAFLKAAGIPWVTQEPGGDLENALAARGPADAPSARTAIRIYGSVLHAATEDLLLGPFTSRMLLAATGYEPEYMGPSEPMERVWETADLTAWLQQQMPVGTLLLAGTGLAGTVTAYRTEAGVVESFDALLSEDQVEGRTPDGEAPPWHPVGRTAVEAAAIEANVQEFGMELHFGTKGLFVQAGHDAFRVPQLLVLGPSLHGGTQPDPSVLEGVDAEVLGVAPFQHLAVRYPASFAWDDGHAQYLQQRILHAVAHTP